MAVNKVVYGTTVLVDLTEDTVNANDLAEGVTAHGANGEKITGTVKVGNPRYTSGTPSYSSGTYKYIGITSTAQEDAIIRKGSEFTSTTLASNFGNATVDDVAKGKTFTSYNGLELTGTMESGGTVASDDNCEAYHITSASTALNFKRTDGTIKVWGYGTARSSYTTTIYAFVGDGYYRSASYGTPTKTSVAWRLNSDGTLSGLPSGLNALDVLVTKGV